MNKLVANFVALMLLVVTSITHAQTFVVGVEDIDYYPLYAYKEGNYQGVAKEVMDKFASSKGYTFKYKPFPVIRLTKYFVEGQVDLKFPDNEVWAGDAKKGLNVAYSNPVIDYTDGVMVLPASAGKGIGALKKLGLVRGFTPWDYLSLIKTGSVKSKETSSLDALIQQTLHGRVDGAYFNVSVAKYHLAQNLKKPDGLVFDDGLPHTSSSYKLSSHKHPKIIEEFSQFLIDEAGWISEVNKKYGL
ncbi:MAG: transporter substrate-binding domain-containing protein [Pseudomonadales bacterium]|nr:transporter substrate-binding domain-containing protein [Pseudomonadales bacterium]